MTSENRDGMTVLTPAVGYVLTNGKGVYSAQVWLGTADAAANWTEITTAEAEHQQASEMW